MRRWSWMRAVGRAPRPGAEGCEGPGAIRLQTHCARGASERGIADAGRSTSAQLAQRSQGVQRTHEPFRAGARSIRKVTGSNPVAPTQKTLKLKGSRDFLYKALATDQHRGLDPHQRAPPSTATCYLHTAAPFPGTANAATLTGSGAVDWQDVGRSRPNPGGWGGSRYRCGGRGMAAWRMGGARGGR